MVYSHTSVSKYLGCGGCGWVGGLLKEVNH